MQLMLSPNESAYLSVILVLTSRSLARICLISLIFLAKKSAFIIPAREFELDVSISNKDANKRQEYKS